MNEILQKRIEEAAEEYANSTTSNLLNVFETTGRFEGFEQGANFALQNQWISVEEALPEKDGIYLVLVNNKTPLITTFNHIKRTFEPYRPYNITHWMEIPSLEGGE